MADATRKRGRRNQIAGQFAARPIEMLKSPAFQVLSRAAHQVLARIEIEHADHGGRDNGRLPVTFDNFVEYGLHRRMIAPAIRELCALGFIVITEHGGGGNANMRRPALYRLTFRNEKNAAGDGTHKWRKSGTLKEAETLARQARDNVNPRSVAHGKKYNPSGRKCTASVAESDTGGDPLPVAETATTGTVHKLPLRSRYRGRVSV